MDLSSCKRSAARRRCNFGNTNKLRWKTCAATSKKHLFVWLVVVCTALSPHIDVRRCVKRRSCNNCWHLNFGRCIAEFAQLSHVVYVAPSTSFINELPGRANDKKECKKNVTYTGAHNAIVTRLHTAKHKRCCNLLCFTRWESTSTTTTTRGGN